MTEQKVGFDWYMHVLEERLCNVENKQDAILELLNNHVRHIEKRLSSVETMVKVWVALNTAAVLALIGLFVERIR